MNIEEKIAHLGFIQSVISRMGGNSFLLKGWSITLVAAIFALSSKDSDSRFLIIAYFPVIVFWALDAYFLRQEKLYRELFSEVANDKSKNSNFCMSTIAFEKKVESIISVALSKTLLLFHGTVISIILFAMFFRKRSINPTFN